MSVATAFSQPLLGLMFSFHYYPNHWDLSVHSPNHLALARSFKSSAYPILSLDNCLALAVTAPVFGDLLFAVDMRETMSRQMCFA